MKNSIVLILLVFSVSTGFSQTLITADRVFDGREFNEGWEVLVDGNKIIAVGENLAKGRKIKERINLSGHTLMPGMIEGHSHMLLYPYDQAAWNDQVLKESVS